MAKMGQALDYQASPQERVRDTSVLDRWKSARNHATSTDIVFLVGPNQEPVRAHKCILASSSEVFNAMLFNTRMRESQTTEIPIGDHRLTADCFQVFLDFVYTGEAILSIKTVFGAQQLAEQYFIPQLAQRCQEFLQKFQTSQHSQYTLSLLVEAERWSAEDILEPVLQTITDQTTEILSQQAFLTLPLCAILKIVQIPFLQISELDLFKRVHEWYSQNPCQKNIAALEHIRYGSISIDDLMNHVKPAVQQGLPERLYTRALEFHARPNREDYGVFGQLRGKWVSTLPQVSQEIKNRSIFFLGPNLSSLDFASNLIGDIGVTFLCKAWKYNKTLTTLRLEGNNIGDEGAICISDALTANSTLTELWLKNNSIGPVGTQHISEALKVNNTLTKLALWANKLGDDGAQHLSEALKSNRALKTLGLSGNNIGDRGCSYLCAGLRVNKTLEILWMYNSPNVGRAAIAQLKSANRNVSVNGI